MEDSMMEELLLDFASQADELYESIQEAVQDLEDGDALAGIIALLGPIHTLKGTAGFISGLEDLAHYIHKVEDYLNLQKTKGEEISSSIRELCLEAIEIIFQVIEAAKGGDSVDISRLKSSEAKLLEDGAEGQELKQQETVQKRAQLPENFQFQSEHEAFIVSRQSGFVIVEATTPRLHKLDHYQFMQNLLLEVNGQAPVIFSFKNVNTMGSNGWGIIAQYAHNHPLTFLGIQPGTACERTYLTFALDRYIQNYLDISDIPRLIREDS